MFMNKAIAVCFMTVLFSSPVWAQAADDFSNLAPTTAVDDPNDPCRYLDQKDAEAIVGELLLTLPFRAVGSGADENGGQCRYVFSGFRAVTIGVMKTGGDKLFQILTGVKYVLDQKMQTPGNLSKALALEGE